MSDTTVGHAVVVADTATLDRPDWLALRRQGIGGSDVSAILGLSPYQTALSVWLEKTGVYVPEDEPTEEMEWGTLLESVVADEFSRRSGVATVECRALLAHPDHDWMRANIDRGIPGLFPGSSIIGVYEGKTTSPWQRKEWGTEDDPKVPDHAALQTQHYLAVTGLPFAYVAVLIGGQRLVWRRVERDDELADHLVRIESEFWKRVENHDPPPPAAADAALLGDIWAPAPASTVTLTDEHLALLAEREAAKKAEREAKERAARAEAAIKLALGDREYGLNADGQIVCSWREVAETPIAAHTRAAYRRFIPHKPKEAKK